MAAAEPARPASRTCAVTGAGGFIGTHLVTRLACDPAIRVVALTRRDSTAAGGASNVTCVARRLETLDAQLWQQLGVSELDCVFHLAAFTPKRRGDDDLEAIWSANLQGTRALCESLPPARRVIYASTLDVYGPSPLQQGPITERTAVAPATLYAASKLFCESLVAAYGRQRRWDTVILRYGHLFGPGEDAYDKLIPRTIRRLLSGRPPGIHGDGSAERDLLYVADAVEATVRAADARAAPARVINVVRGESVAIAEVVARLIALTGYIGPVRHYPEQDGARSLRFDSAQMRSLLGEWPLTPLVEGLRDEVADVGRRLLRQPGAMTAGGRP